MPITNGRYVITDFEMDKLFEYTREGNPSTNPIDLFGLGPLIAGRALAGMAHQARSAAIQDLVDRSRNGAVRGFREYLSEQRRHRGSLRYLIRFQE